MYVDFRGTGSKVVGGTAEPDTSEILFDDAIKDAVVAFVGDDSRPFCTGTCLTPTVVLTAAHCPIRKDDRVMVGNDTLSPKAAARVRLFETNPNWNRTLSDHGLVLLDRPLPVGAVALTNDVSPAQSVYTGGYGLTAAGARSQTLKWWLKETIETVDSDEFVIQGEGVHGLCHGDSGGPAFVKARDGTPAVAGTVSMGSATCVGADRFSRVARSRGWIDDTLKRWERGDIDSTNSTVQTAAISPTIWAFGAAVILGVLALSLKR